MSDLSLPRQAGRRFDASTVRGTLRTQVQVLWALMLHDIKSRFFGSGLGYIVTILWPSAHIAIVMIAFIVSRRPVPYGNSALLYASTGVLPYIAWNYMSRFTMLTVVQNRSFLSYSIIKPLDMMFARLALEHVSIFIVTLGLIATNLLFQVDIVPIDLKEVIFGMLSSVLLGIGFGILNSVIAMIFPLWFLGYVGILLLFWFTAGLAINPEALPDAIGYWFSWNPLLHSIEWIRVGYYPDFPAHLLSKSYVLYCGAGSLTLGLLLERLLRKYLKG